MPAYADRERSARHDRILLGVTADLLAPLREAPDRARSSSTSTGRSLRSWPARSLRRFPRRPALELARLVRSLPARGLRQRPDGGRSEPSRRSGRHPLRRVRARAGPRGRTAGRPHRRVQGRGRPGGRGQAADALVPLQGARTRPPRGENSSASPREPRGWPRRRWGRKVLEIRPSVAADKGTAVRTLLEEAGANRALYAGTTRPIWTRSPLWRGPTSTTSSVWQSSRVKGPRSSPTQRICRWKAQRRWPSF